jgi:hypothetical protein
MKVLRVHQLFLLASVLALGIIIACSKAGNPQQTQQQKRDLIVATTVSASFASGNMGAFDVTDNTAYKNLLQVHSDTKVTTYNGSIYVLEKWGKDNVIKITGSIIKDSAIAYQVGIGQAVNISDMAFVNDTKAYITQNLDSTLVVFNPATGVIVKKVSLSQFNTYVGTDSAAPIPYMNNVLVHNGKTYVSCQRLKKDKNSNALLPADTSLVAILSTVTDEVIGSVKLNKKNPNAMDISGEKLYVVCTGSYFDTTDGAIECIDLVNGATSGIVAEESAFSGSISGIIAVSQSKAYVSVVKLPSSWTDYYTQLVELNLATGAVGVAIQDIKNAFGGLAYDGKYLYVGERALDGPGIIVVDPVTNKKVSGPFDLGLPPYSLAYLKMN